MEQVVQSLAWDQSSCTRLWETRGFNSYELHKETSGHVFEWGERTVIVLYSISGCYAKEKNVISVLDNKPKSPLPVIISGVNDKEASSTGCSFADILKNDKDIVNGNVNIKNLITSSGLDNSTVDKKIE
ncbi:hypothetical protein MA16_Dca022062 [Dendrobium catenatum]|uniref:Uncharacterized protein n=1 Tax=Dendrobium catenatum TaxID=906689 RepID=A0A2I0X062_9ASPA|nr:hypothetical protein MA16_Dca022062 [Dendrobium catenatum]